MFSNPKNLPRLTLIFGIPAAVLMAISLYLIFMWVPTEREMGIVQRIFYFHVPSPFMAFLAFFTVAGYSIAFLRKRNHWHDRIAFVAAEIGIVFCLFNLISGSIWARPIWNTWWTWDARLTTMLILFLIYIAYVMLRDYAGDNEKGARFAAVFAIIGTVDIPIVYFSIRWWRTMHPKPVIMGGSDSGLAPEMQITLLVSLVAFIFLFYFLLTLRLRLEHARLTVQHMQQQKLLHAK